MKFFCLVVLTVGSATLSAFSNDVFEGFPDYEMLSSQIRSSMSDTVKEEAIRKGFDLKYFAEVYYGSSLGWPLVWFLNANEISDPELVKAGTKLKIPRLRPNISSDEASRALENAYKLVYWVYAHDERHKKAQRQWVLNQAQIAGIDVRNADWQTILDQGDLDYIAGQKRNEFAEVKTTPRPVIVNVKLTGALIAVAKNADESGMAQLIAKAEKSNALKDLVGDLEIEATKPDSDHKPEVHFALALSYGRLGLKGKEYGALLKAEEAAKKPGVSFNIAIIYGRKQLLESSVDADTFLVGGLSVETEPSGAKIYVDNTLLGQSPSSLTKLKIGEHQITLELEGFLKLENQVRVNFNEITTVKQTLTKEKPGIVMVDVEGGVFMMGTTDKAVLGAQPAHKVKLDSFRISSTEVSQALYQNVMGTNPSYFVDEKKPVEGVTWYDAVDFCNKLSERDGLIPAYIIDKKTKDPNNFDASDKLKWKVTLNKKGNGYRLPTEAQWEFAARGGNKSGTFRFSGGDSVDEVAWYSDNSGDKTHELAMKSANELGIFDMSGNVDEWCWDWYGEYSIFEQSNPLGPAIGKFHVKRGGGSSDSEHRVTNAARANSTSLYSYVPHGIRLVLPSGK